MSEEELCPHCQEYHVYEVDYEWGELCQNCLEYHVPANPKLEKSDE